MKLTQRQIQKEETRKKIIHSAYEEFCENGIMATRTSDIARRAGVSHGTIFAHFKTQEELINEVVNIYSEKMVQRTHDISREKASVQDLLKAHLEGIDEFEEFYIKLVSEAKILPKDSRNAFVLIQSAVCNHLSEVLQSEIENGKIKDLPINFIFNTWIGILNYYLENKDLFAPDGSVIKRYGDKLIEYFMQLISK